MSRGRQHALATLSRVSITARGPRPMRSCVTWPLSKTWFQSVTDAKGAEEDWPKVSRGTERERRNGSVAAMQSRDCAYPPP